MPSRCEAVRGSNRCSVTWGMFRANHLFRTIRAMRRHHYLLPRSALAALAVCLALGAPFASQAQSYTITDLGTLGGSFRLALGLNSRGQVVGNSFTADDQALHAFIYSDGKMHDLGTLGGT